MRFSGPACTTRRSRPRCPAGPRNWPGATSRKGFCWIAIRPDLAAVWSRAGPNLVIEPAQLWASAHETPGQEIVFIGIRLDPGGPRRILEPALLTDDELASGPTAWVRFDDPRPAWDAVHRH